MKKTLQASFLALSLLVAIPVLAAPMPAPAQDQVPPAADMVQPVAGDATVNDQADAPDQGMFQPRGQGGRFHGGMMGRGSFGRGQMMRQGSQSKEIGRGMGMPIHFAVICIITLLLMWTALSLAIILMCKKLKAARKAEAEAKSAQRS